MKRSKLASSADGGSERSPSITRMRTPSPPACAQRSRICAAPASGQPCRIPERTYASPLGSLSRKRSPATTLRRSAWPALSTTCGRSNSVPRRCGCAARRIRSSAPLPPPTSTTCSTGSSRTRWRSHPRSPTALPSACRTTQRVLFVRAPRSTSLRRGPGEPVRTASSNRVQDSAQIPGASPRSSHGRQRLASRSSRDRSVFA